MPKRPRRLRTPLPRHGCDEIAAGIFTLRGVVGLEPGASIRSAPRSLTVPPASMSLRDRPSNSSGWCAGGSTGRQPLRMCRFEAVTQRRRRVPSRWPDDRERQHPETSPLDDWKMHVAVIDLRHNVFRAPIVSNFVGLRSAKSSNHPVPPQLRRVRQEHRQWGSAACGHHGIIPQPSPTRADRSQGSSTTIHRNVGTGNRFAAEAAAALGGDAR